MTITYMVQNRSIFVDTGAWFALAVKSDIDHLIALEWLKNNQSPLITTDYIIDELLTLLLTRVNAHMATQVGQTLLEGNMAHIAYLTQEDIHQAWQVFKTHTDKQWSFTDCTSKVFMERLNIQEAFSFDKHFEQFGTILRVPK